MKKIYLLLLAIFVFNSGRAQVQIGSTNYPTLKAAFDAINLGTHTGIVSVSVTGNTSEALSPILYQSGYNAGNGHFSSYSSITISPSGTGSRTILFTAGNASLQFNKASNVTIDGLNKLTLANAQTQATTVNIYNSASDITITNCNILGSGVIAVLQCINDFGVSNNITVSNCNVGPYDSNLPTNGISIYSENVPQTGLNISGNNVYDFNSSTVRSSGIILEGRIAGFAIQNNRIYQTAPRAAYESTPINILLSSNGILAGTKLVAGNEIGSANALGTGTYALTAGKFRGISYNYYGPSYGCTIQNNNIRHISVSGNALGTTSTAGLMGIRIQDGVVSIQGNTIGSLTEAGSITFTSGSASEAIGIFKFGEFNTDILNNTIGGIAASGNDIGIRAIYLSGEGNTQNPTLTCNNNTIGGNLPNSIISTSSAANTNVAGIWLESLRGNVNANTISNLTGYGIGASYPARGVLGIYNLQPTTIQPCSMADNRIFNLSNANPTEASFVGGIFSYYASQAASATLQRNQIYSLQSASTNNNALVMGIFCNGNTPNFYNNMIALGAGINGASICGFRNETESTIFSKLIKNNSIYIGGIKTSGNSASVAYYQLGTMALDFRIDNNIFVNNRSNNGATGVHSSIRADLQYVIFKNNIYYGNGTGYVFGYNYTNPKTSLSQWNAWPLQGGNTGYFSDPRFIDPESASPNLHISPTIPTMVEGRGNVAVADDVDQEIRNNLTPSDIGADAGNFVAITQPVITGLSATSTCTNAPLSLVISGTGFTAVTEVRIGSTLMTITNASATSITVLTGSAVLSGNIYVSNEAGTGVSASVFNEYLPPSITASPVSVSVCSNRTTSFSATASNAASYQWRRNGVNLANGAPFSNVTTSTLTITNPNISENGSNYDVIAYSPENTCNVVSAAATLTVFPLPLPVIQSSGASPICAGTSVTLSTTSGYVSYVWSNGATTPTITVTAAGNYSVTATNSNGCSALSAIFSIAVNPNVTYYADSDGDSFGNSAVSVVSCMGSPANYVTDNTDCNDADATKHQNYPFYVDTDGDSYGAGSLVSVCAVNATTSPANYSLNNTDCNNNNAAVYRSATLYRDVDGDGYTVSAAVMCYGAQFPAGYSLTNLGNDCNDNDPTRHLYYVFYVDSDGDGYGSGNLVPVCAVSSVPPANFSTNNTDCNPGNPAVYRSALLYTDLDGDGYSTSSAVTCYGAALPTGYSLTSSGSDCDDANALMHQSFPFYVDNDGDNYGTGSLVSVCATGANTPPPGYSLTGADCNDNDAIYHQQFSFYADNDADGYGSGGIVLLCAPDANTPPSGFSTIGTDCDDNNAAVHPGAAEILYDGTDNNCDGQLDEGFRLTTKLSPADCGATIAASNSPINIITVENQITRYRIKIAIGGNEQFFETATPQFSLTDFISPTYASTYAISIELQRNGIWLGYYGDTCQITTPTPANGIFESYAIVSTFANPLVYYDMQATTPNADFNGANLGTFGTNGGLIIKGQNKLFAYGCPVVGSNLHYRVYAAAAVPGSFNSVAEPFFSNIDNLGGQIWQSNTASPNLIEGLEPGNYILEIYSDADGLTCPSGTYLSNNSGNNFKATFKVQLANPVLVTATAGTPSAAYANMTAAFNAINSGTHQGNILIRIAGDTTEQSGGGALLINSGQYTAITINPVGHVTVSANSTATSNSVLTFLSSHDITVDGLNTAENSLTVSSFSGSFFVGPSAQNAIQFFGGTANNLKNCTLLGASAYVYNAASNTTTQTGQCLNIISGNNLTVLGCNFGSAGTYAPIFGINGYGTNIAIANNNIHDYFADDIVSAGIHTSGASSNWSITDNKFYQTTPKTWNYNGSENAAIMITPAIATSPGVSQGFTITGNIIGYATANQQGVYSLKGNAQSPKAHFCGIHFKGLGSVDALPTVISNNAIASVGLTENTSRGTGIDSPFVGILFESGNGTCNGNIIGSQTTNGSLVFGGFNTPYSAAVEVYGLLNASVNPFTSNNNSIGGIIADGYSPPVLYAMRSSAANGIWTANGNTIGGVSPDAIKTPSTLYGLANDSFTGNFSSNTIRNLTGSTVVGIKIAGNNTVERNFIYNLNGGILNGIWATGGTSVFKNNMIALGTNVNNAWISGFNDTGGNNSLYHNSVYIGGTAISGTFDSFALVDSGIGSKDYRNNIFVNDRLNSGATGKNYVISIASNSGLTLDKNIYFGNSAANTFGLMNNILTGDFAAWQAAIPDAGSYFSNPNYLNPIAAIPDLHINPSTPTAAEHKGIALPSVTDDFDGQSRTDLTPTDIGADAGNFTMVSPTITNLSATSGCTGSSLVITGTYLAEVTQVFIGGTAAIITDTTNTTVTVTVGTGSTGIVSVFNGMTANSNAAFTVIPQLSYYADSDGDGYGDALSSVLSCTSPIGYVLNNTDCAPADPNRWRSGNFYIDADNDSYYNGNPETAAVCYGTLTPNGYVASINGTDCNDNNSDINPNNVEVLANGLDDNCDGSIDEEISSSNIIPSQCGTTLSNIANTIYATQPANATGYRFEITNGSNKRIYESTVNAFTLINLEGGASYATTYAIRVAVKTNGFWRGYSISCNITTPPLHATTNVIASTCGTTLANMAALIYCNQVTAASQYRFQITDVTNASNVWTYDSAVNRFSMANLGAGIAYGTTYAVKVALKFGSAFDPFGPACNITTPAAPGLTNLISSQCGITISNRWTTLYANQVPDAQGYRFEITNGATVRIVDRSTSNFALQQMPGGVAASTTYSVRVAVLYNGNYGAFGPACNVATAGVISRQAAAPVVVFDVRSYPSPFVDVFKLSINTSGDQPVMIKIYDMIGKLVESREFGMSEIDSQQFGGKCPSGVYNMIVAQGENIQTLRLIKR